MDVSTLLSICRLVRFYFVRQIYFIVKKTKQNKKTHTQTKKTPLPNVQKQVKPHTFQVIKNQAKYNKMILFEW